MKPENNTFIVPLCAIIVFVYQFTDALCWKFQKRVLWRHFRIETPRVKRWWKKHCEKMQRKLDMEHGAKSLMTELPYS